MVVDALIIGYSSGQCVSDELHCIFNVKFLTTSFITYRLGLSYVDLYLIHCPSPGKNVDSYRAMMKLKEQGLIR